MKPEIIVTSEDDDDTFRFMSVGWFEMKVRHTKKAQDLMAKAKKCIHKGNDVKDSIKLLEKAGFKVTRGSDYEDSIGFC